MPPQLNRKRALFVLTEIDEILAWERQKKRERDTRFVELGRYLCEVRAEYAFLLDSGNRRARMSRRSRRQRGRWARTNRAGTAWR
jgi:hypothetical protein